MLLSYWSDIHVSSLLLRVQNAAKAALTLQVSSRNANVSDPKEVTSDNMVGIKMEYNGSDKLEK